MKTLEPSSRTALAEFMVAERELTAQGSLSALLHAIGTPLQVIAGRATLAERADSLDEAHKHLAVLTRKAEELRALLEGVARNQPKRSASEDIVGFREIFDSLRHWSTEVLGASIELSVHGTSEASVMHARLLVHALKSLVVTLLAAPPGEQKLTIQLVLPPADAALSARTSMSLMGNLLELSVSVPKMPISDAEDTSWVVPRELAKRVGGSVSLVNGSLVMTWPCTPR